MCNKNGIYSSSSKLHFTHIYHLSWFQQFQAYIVLSLSLAPPLCLKQFTTTLVSHSEGILFSFNIQLKRLVILPKPALPDANNISITRPDAPEALPFFILVKTDFTLIINIENQLLNLLAKAFRNGIT